MSIHHETASLAADGQKGSVPLYRVKAFYFSSFCFFATYFRYMTLYFEADGLTTTQIGTIIAVQRVLTTVVTPFWNGLADRTKRARTIIQASLLACVAPFLFLAIPLDPESGKFFGRAGAIWLFSISAAPVSSLSDALARAACDQDIGLWGKARLYGAVGWACMHLVLGPLMDRFGFIVLWVSFLVMNANLFVVVRGMPQACSEVRREVSAKAVFAIFRRQPLFFLNIAVVGAGFSMVEGLLFILLQEMKASSMLCGLSVVVTVVFELPIFSHADAIYRRLGAKRMVLLGQAAWVVRAVFYAKMPEAWMVLLIEPLHGFTFAMVWIAASQHVASPAVSGSGLEASAQGLLSICFSGLGSTMGMFWGGALFDLVGSHTAYVVFAAIVAASGVAYALYGDDVPAQDRPKDTPQKAPRESDEKAALGDSEAPVRPALIGATAESEAAARVVGTSSPASPKEDVRLMEAAEARH